MNLSYMFVFIDSFLYMFQEESEEEDEKQPEKDMQAGMMTPMEGYNCCIIYIAI